MKNAVFVTGTDTGVGKTVVTGLLGRFFEEEGRKVITQKWVQTGCDGIPGDIDAHMKAIGTDGRDVEKYRSDMAPYVLKFPSSPHLAASMEGKHIDAGKIERAFRRLEAEFDVVLVEGTGGLLVPISDEKVIADIVERLGLPVLVVAENRLGAINQTLLTVEALKKRALQIEGIVFNRLSEDGDDLILKDNMRIVERLTGEKILGELSCKEDADVRYKEFLSIGKQLLL